MDKLILSAFLLVLIACIIFCFPILYALVAGYFLFCFYALKRGFGIKDVAKMSLYGIGKTKNILITFLLIGILTSLWRAGGTIAAVVCACSKIMHPAVFVMVSFVLCCLISFLTGTAFGTSATMGTICMTISNALGINPAIMGGAILSGAYFGDRCSPVSTSALLVSEITQTDLYKNIKNMLKTSAVPFVLTCVLFLLIGFVMPPENTDLPDIETLFESEFYIGIFAFVPALVILVLSLFKVNVKISMALSIVASAMVCLFCAEIPLSEIIEFSVFGFESENADVSRMMSGGGIISMLKVTAIVCISSCYSGIFDKTDLLCSMHKMIETARGRVSSYCCTLVTSLFTSAVACNQTLSIMLTNQLCKNLEKDKDTFAIYLENSAVVVAPLFPWSIACAVSLSSAGAPIEGVLFSFYLMIIPLYSLFVFKKGEKIKTT